MTSTLATVEARDQQIALALRWKAFTDAGVQGVVAKAISSETLVSDTFTPRVKNAIAEVNKLQARIAETAATPAEKQAIEKVAQARQAVLDVIRKVEESRQGGENSALLALTEQELVPATARYLGGIDEYVVLQERLRDEAKAAAMAHTDRVELLSWLAIAGMLMTSLAGVAWMVHSITRPLKDAVEAAEAIAGGDLTHRLQTRRRDELGQLITAIARMAEQLHDIVIEVRRGVTSVTMASAEIATGNHDLSARTERMASSLQQTASSMEELTATVTQSAENAREVNQLAADAAASAGRGGAVVEQVVSSMVRISEGSRRIADIIGTIDGIAFQTNILALNAAVEAARAGEHGRGFAVVAGEVRALAQRSAEAAKEIKGLIGASVETVGTGSALVEQTGHAMKEIVASIQRVSDLIGFIAAAASEQRDGIGQVNSAVGHLDQTTQQNAALVEQSAAAAQSLQQQAQRLAQVVSVFNLADGDDVAAAPSLPRAPSVAPPAQDARDIARHTLARVRAQATAPKPEPVAPAPAKAAVADTGHEEWTSF
ncbi:methyl-accepting chemotaxis protein [Azohydromonas caseinilytica]|uniref:methyl-accepting chemotaxis protein n=1 Tax=Azohydromonas caseinilytica TaxID=2728836 RepID=UPI002872ACC1|nr:methyl-accepting chemotaxis protein [Azohydromonas caseinilytica]